MPSCRRLRRLLSRYASLREVAAVCHVDDSTVCAWCAICGLQRKQLKRCPLNPDEVRKVHRLRKQGKPCREIASSLGIDRQLVKLVIDELN